MSIPKKFTSFAGKENLMASFNHWLMDTIQGGQLGGTSLQEDKEFFWSFDFPIIPQFLPAISSTETGLFNIGDEAFSRFLGYNEHGDPVYGSRNQTLIEISCVATDGELFTGATNKVRNLRDRVVHALNAVIIPLRDYSKQSAPQVGIIEVDPESNSINEKFLVDPSNQNIKRYVIIVRVFWTEFENRSNSQSINSDAEIS